MRKTAIQNRIIWILIAVTFWYIILFGGICAEPFFSYTFYSLTDNITYMHDGMVFVLQLYLSTVTAFIGAFIYTAVFKRNRFILRSFLPGYNGTHSLKQLGYGLAVGFIMNFACIAAALAHGDIKLYFSFAAVQIPFYIIALVCVFIQSASEELWCRGVMYERINVHYPVWVAILINGAYFGLLHMANPGATTLAIADIVVCGLSFSIAKWYTGSIWFPAGIHTAWNFTQNLLFGLPNSGLVPEVSVFTLDAASARSNLIYDVGFGVEGAVPAVLVDAALGIICLVLAYKQGRLGELTMSIEKAADKAAEASAVTAAETVMGGGTDAGHTE